MATQYYEGIGRRKSSSARARLSSGGGTVTCNTRTGAEYFPRMGDLDAVVGPLTTAGLADKYDVSIKVEGGGVTGQVGAAKLAVARALLKIDPELRKAPQARPQGPDLHQALNVSCFAARRRTNFEGRRYRRIWRAFVLRRWCKAFLPRITRISRIGINGNRS